MSLSLKDYTGVILDATFFTKPFPQTLVSQLSDAKLQVTITYRARVNHNRQMLGKAQREIFEHNLKLLDKYRLEVLPANVPDLYSNLCLMSKSAREHSARYLLITADRLCIQQVVLEKLMLDVYDLDWERRLLWQDYEAISKMGAFDFQGSEDPVVPITLHQRRPGILYNENGDPVQVKPVPIEGSDIGAEARIYPIRGTGQPMVAKVYLQDRLTEGKRSNLTDLKAIHLEQVQDWAIMPQELLYWDKERTQLAGFAQRYATGVEKKVFYDNPLFIMTDDAWVGESKKYNQGLTLKAAACLTRQVCYLNVYGIYVGDFNSSNFAADQLPPDNLIMWDTDSFCYRDYFSETQDPRIFGTIRKAKRAPGRKAQAIDACIERLYAKVFWILTLGASPLDTQGNFTDPAVQKAFVPKNLWSLFEDVFVKKVLPSPDLLLHELDIALERWNASTDKPNFAQLYEREKRRAEDAARNARRKPNPSREEPSASGNRSDTGTARYDTGGRTRKPDDVKTVRPNYQFTGQADEFCKPLLMGAKVPPVQYPGGCNVTQPRRRQSDLSYSQPKTINRPLRNDRFTRLTSNEQKNLPAGLYLPRWLLFAVLALLAAAYVFGLLDNLEFKTMVQLHNSTAELIDGAKNAVRDVIQFVKNFFQPWLETLTPNVPTGT